MGISDYKQTRLRLRLNTQRIVIQKIADVEQYLQTWKAPSCSLLPYIKLPEDKS